MRILLKELRIINFKGIRSLTLKFNDHQTFIMGRNGSGKSTISDAYHWLLTGKNSQDEKDFEIKPISSDGSRAQKLNNEVSAILLVDGEVINIRKVHSEKWTKPKGQPEAVFSGNTVDYFWNDVPVKQKEFQDKINAIIPEAKLKLFSNTQYFNGMKWNDRRGVLIDMAGPIDSDAIIRENKNFHFINDLLAQRKSLDEFKKELAVKKKSIKEELDGIPGRVDEVQRNIAGLQRPFERLRYDLEKAQTELGTVDAAISSKEEAYRQQDAAINDQRKRKHELENKASNISASLRRDLEASANKPDERKQAIEAELKDKRSFIAVAHSSILTLDERIKNGNAKISDAQAEIAALDQKIEACKTDWRAANARTLTFQEGYFCCPACKQELPAEEVTAQRERLTTNFNTQRQSDLKEAVDRSEKYKAAKAEQEGYIDRYSQAIKDFQVQREEDQKKFDTAEQEIIRLNDELNAYTNAPKDQALSISSQHAIALEEHPEYNTLIDQVQAIDRELEEYKPVDTADLVARRKDLQATVDDLRQQLLNESLIKTSLERIEELQQQERTLSQNLADLERQEYYMMQFNIEKMNEVERRVNSMFSYVSFRMFDRQVNGETVEVCDTLVDGKPIHGGAVNTASVVNAGVDIINALSKHYDLYTPMFIDGRESVTDLIASESQIINLIVSAAHDALTVEESEPQAYLV